MTDLIRRQDAIDALSRGSGCGNSCRKAIENLPSAEQPYFIQLKNIVSNDDFSRILEDLKHQCKNIVLLHEYEQLVYPAQRWIPCSERLPEKSDDVVLVTVTDERRIRDIYLMRCDEVESAYIMKWISAWMPLPEPFKGGD